MKNFTPHDVRVVLSDQVKIYPTIGVCRALASESCAMILDLTENPPLELHHGNWASGSGVGRVVVMDPPAYKGLEWIPGEPGEGETVIVSIVAAPVVAEERPDLTVMVPDTGPGSAVRSDSGKIAGVKRLILWHRPFKPIEIIQPFNPANPCDGWWTVGSFYEAEWSEAIELAAFKAHAMYLVPGCQPCDADWRDAEEGEGRRDAAKSYLTGGLTHWEHLAKQGLLDSDQGRERRKDLPDGCWARRAYDEGYDEPDCGSLPAADGRDGRP